MVDQDSLINIYNIMCNSGVPIQGA